MISLLQDKWKELKCEWQSLDRKERIYTVWELGNIAGIIVLPLLLIFTFFLSAPRLPPANILLVLVAIGIIYGGSIIFQDPIMKYIDLGED